MASDVVGSKKVTIWLAISVYFSGVILFNNPLICAEQLRACTSQDIYVGIYASSLKGTTLVLHGFGAQNHLFNHPATVIFWIGNSKSMIGSVVQHRWWGHRLG